MRADSIRQIGMHLMHLSMCGSCFCNLVTFLWETLGVTDRLGPFPIIHVGIKHVWCHFDVYSYLHAPKLNVYSTKTREANVGPVWMLLTQCFLVCHFWTFGHWARKTSNSKQLTLRKMLAEAGVWAPHFKCGICAWDSNLATPEDSTQVQYPILKHP